MKKVTLIPGDGIGPEIVESVKRIFKAAEVQIEWELAYAGQTALDFYDNLLPSETLESIKRNKVALKAPLTTPVGKGFRSVNVQLRKELDLYANVRPIMSLEGVDSPLKNGENINITIFRENTEGLYAGVEHMVGEDAAETIKVITRKASDRIIRKAFGHAVDSNNWGNRRKVTVVHKANIQKLTDGLFLDVANELYHIVDGRFDFEDKIIDNMCMQLVQRPQDFDIIVTTNLYGDIISDLCASLVGGLGVAPGANIGDDCAVYEAVHGTAPDIAGKGLANPTSLLLSACMMLRDPNINDHVNANKIEDAIKKTLAERRVLTGDLGGSAGTMEFTDAIISNIKVPVS